MLLVSVALCRIHRLLASSFCFLVHSSLLITVFSCTVHLLPFLFPSLCSFWSAPARYNSPRLFWQAYVGGLPAFLFDIFLCTQLRRLLPSFWFWGYRPPLFVCPISPSTCRRALHCSRGGAGKCSALPRTAVPSRVLLNLA